ncbi:hypothetical protein [Aquimarina sp. 2304DJ70-9]|uniref:hypothetical protein n=1 Tax=Aquimarina penaris TaxID=3231044 RepID=UPI003462EED1
MESNFTDILLRVTGILFYIVPILFFIILAIYYLSKADAKTPGILILIGNILILLVAIANQFLYLFIQEWGMDLFSLVSVVVNAISFVGYVLFLIGFFMIIQKTLKKQNSSI